MKSATRAPDDRTPVTHQGFLAPVSFQPLLVQRIPDMQAVVGAMRAGKIMVISGDLTMALLAM